MRKTHKTVNRDGEQFSAPWSHDRNVSNVVASAAFDAAGQEVFQLEADRDRSSNVSCDDVSVGISFHKKNCFGIEAGLLDP